MKKALHILTLAVFCCVTLLSCEKLVFEEGAVICGDDSVQVSLRISTGDEGETRALTGTDEPGTDYENYLDISGLRILLFDDNNRFLQQFTPDEVRPVDKSEYPSKWELRGTLGNPPSGRFKIVALANWPYAPTGLKAGKTTIEDVCKAEWAMGTYTGTDTDPFTPSAATPIPMYGVRTQEALYFRSDVETYLGEIDLLRAFAKITLCAESGTEITSVTLKKYNRTYACAPIGMYTNTSQSNAVHLSGEAGDNNPGTSLSFSQSKDKTAWTIYVPEYLNAGPSGTARGDCSFIELTVKGSGDTYRIDFRDYSTAADDGNRFDIIRNYEYRYTVKATPLLFSVTVEKWQFGGKVIIDL